MKRDAKADLEMCERATPGPYISWPQTGGDHALVERVFRDEQDRRCLQFLAVCGSVGVDNSANAALFAESREALPYWIKRAQEAEEGKQKAEELLKEIADAPYLQTTADANITYNRIAQIIARIIEFLGAEPCDK